MRSVKIILDNAKYAASLPEARALLGSEPVWWSVSDEGSTVSALLSSADDADRRCLSRFWSPSAFWVPSFTPKGFPLFCVDSVSLGVSYANALAAGGVDTYLVTDFDDLFVHLFRRVCVFVVPDPLSSSFYTFCGDFVVGNRCLCVDVLLLCGASPSCGGLVMLAERRPSAVPPRIIT
jgi:hypothetical protein